MTTFFIILLVITSLIIIVATLLMEPKTGAGSAYGQEANVYGTSAYRGKDALLNKLTIITSLIFLVSLLGLVIFK